MLLIFSNLFFKKKNLDYVTFQHSTNYLDCA